MAEATVIQAATFSSKRFLYQKGGVKAPVEPNAFTP